MVWFLSYARQRADRRTDIHTATLIAVLRMGRDNKIGGTENAGRENAGLEYAGAIEPANSRLCGLLTTCVAAAVATVVPPLHRAYLVNF